MEVTDKEYAEKLRKDLNCLASNGIVKLANGERKMIKQLKIGDQVMTVKNESGMTTFSPVTDIKFHQGKKIQRVTEFSLKSNFKQSLWFFNFGWKESTNLFP